MRLPLFHYATARPSSRAPRIISASRLISRVARVMQRPTSGIAAFFLCFIALAWLYLRPWSTVWLLSPSRYHSTLRQSIMTSFPMDLQHDLLQALESPSWSTNATNGIPPHLFQTDRNAPSAADEETWIRQGFTRQFFDDAQASRWVEAHFGNSEVARIYRDLPLPIMCVQFP